MGELKAMRARMVTTDQALAMLDRSGAGRAQKK
jgi:hypothetical protein